MNNSKFFIKLGVIVFSLTALYIVSNVALERFSQRRTSKTNFFHGNSKFVHMGLNHEKSSLDILFIGNSRTKYHISKHEFSKVGLNVYNLGISGLKLSTYATVANTAKSIKPKEVVFGIRVQRLYEKSWALPLMIDFYSVKAMSSAGADYVQILTAAWKMLEGTNKIRFYADGINSRVKQVSKKFDPKKTTKKKVAKKVKVDYGLEDGECDIAKETQKTKEKVELKCTNGDSILYGDIDASTFKPADLTTFGDIEASKISYLNTMVDALKAEGISVRIILDPIFDNPLTYDLEKIRALVHAPIIDNTDAFKLRPKLWYNAGHLNAVGRKLYSAKLAAQIRESR